MTTATKTFENKGVFHSALVKASGRDGLAVMFTGPVRDSKYAGKPPYIPFKVQGEDGDHTLTIENDLVREVLEGAPQNVWVVVRAEGSRDTATVIIEDADGNYVNAKVPVNEIAQPKPNQQAGNPPPNEWPEVEGPYPPELDEKQRAVRATLAERYYIALCAAHDALKRFANDHDGMQPSEAARGIATTLFINASNGR